MGFGSDGARVDYVPPVPLRAVSLPQAAHYGRRGAEKTRHSSHLLVTSLPVFGGHRSLLENDHDPYSHRGDRPSVHRHRRGYRVRPRLDRGREPLQNQTWREAMSLVIIVAPLWSVIVCSSMACCATGAAPAI
jgi:hypothetical protein